MLLLPIVCLARRLRLGRRQPRGVVCMIGSLCSMQQFDSRLAPVLGRRLMFEVIEMLTRSVSQFRRLVSIESKRRESVDPRYVKESKNDHSRYANQHEQRTEPRVGNSLNWRRQCKCNKPSSALRCCPWAGSPPRSGHRLFTPGDLTI